MDATRTWRYQLGILLFALGNLSVVLGIVLPVIGLGSVVGATVIGAMIVGGEVLSMASIVFIGKAGFLALKQKLFGAAKEGYAAPIGRTRHRIGITLFLMNGLTTYLIVLYAWAAFSAEAEGSHIVWGLDLAQQWKLVLGLFLTGELSFLLSLYVLGADWWERFRNVFVWQQPLERTST
jgi:hypothetical protein